MRRCGRLAAAALLAAALAAPAFAAAQATPVPAPTPAPEPVLAPAPVVSPVPTAAGTGVEVRLYNRVITKFRSPIFSSTAEERAQNTRRHLRELLREGGEGKVEVRTVPQGKAFTIDGRFGFLLLPGDADAAVGETLDAAAKRTAETLQRVVSESQESRNLDTILRNAAKAGVATAIATLLVWVLARLRGWIAKALANIGSRHAGRLKMGGQALFGREQVFALARFLTIATFWLLAAFVVYEWLAYTMSLFPWTRPWGEGLLGAAFGLAARIATAVLESLPNLAVAATIFWLAWLASRFIDHTLEPFIRGERESAHIDRDTGRPTRNLLVIGVWVFAIAMSYPYLPGSDSEAFKGLSVLVGLMISLGSTSLVGQAASGLIVMYTRTLRPGEFVRIGEHEGTVVELGAFTTRIRTGLGEELTISNSTIAGGITKNYSRAVKGRGFVVDTVCTIGYDTPWRQVHAMLVEAARRTEGILADPAPVVFQTGLADFYPEYRLVAQAVPSDPRPRAIVMSDLHANIQDVFNEYGVQIMSPHYLGDPAEAKVVPPAKWHPAPAPQPGEGKSRG